MRRNGMQRQAASIGRPILLEFAASPFYAAGAASGCTALGEFAVCRHCREAEACGTDERHLVQGDGCPTALLCTARLGQQRRHCHAPCSPICTRGSASSVSGGCPRASLQVMEPDPISALAGPSQERRARCILKLGSGKVEGARSARAHPQASAVARAATRTLSIDRRASALQGVPSGPAARRRSRRR